MSPTDLISHIAIGVWVPIPWGLKITESITCRSHVYYLNLCAFVVAVSVGCRRHAPGAEKIFDVGSSDARKFWTRDAKLGRLVDLEMAYLASYNLMGWSAVCTCSARASVLYRLFFYRSYRPKEGHRSVPSLQVTHILPQSVCFSGCCCCGVQAARARTEKLYSRGSSGSRKFWAGDTKFGTLVEFNVQDSMVHCIWWWGA